MKTSFLGVVSAWCLLLAGLPVALASETVVVVRLTERHNDGFNEYDVSKYTVAGGIDDMIRCIVPSWTNLNFFSCTCTVWYHTNAGDLTPELTSAPSLAPTSAPTASIVESEEQVEGDDPISASINGDNGLSTEGIIGLAVGSCFVIAAAIAFRRMRKNPEAASSTLDGTSNLPGESV